MFKPYYTLNNMVVAWGEVFTLEDWEFMQRNEGIPHKKVEKAIFPYDSCMLKYFPEMESRVKELLMEATEAQEVWKMNKYKRMLMWSSYSKNFDKEKAKSFPITDFYEFKNNMAKCLWHEDDKPSLHYYPKSNTVFCFACGKYGDVADILMALNGMTFKQAVLFLNGI